MALILFVLSLAVGLFGVHGISIDAPVSHIISIFLGAAVLLSASFVVEAIDRNTSRLLMELRSLATAVRSAQSRATDGVSALTQQHEQRDV